MNDEIKIQPKTTADYRNLLTTLNEDNKQYDTYTLPDEKKPQVVIKGITTEIEPEEVEDFLVQSWVYLQT